MTSRQNAIYEMFHAVRETCDSHRPDWTGNAPFSTTYALYEPMLEDLHEAIAKQQAGNTGPAAQKDSLREMLENAAFTMANAAYAYAGFSGAKALAPDVKITRRQLDKASEAELVGMATSIYNRARALPVEAVAPFGITPATLAALERDTTNFDALIGAPAAAHAVTTEATDEIKEQMDAISFFLKERLDSVTRLLMNTAPVFVNEYFIARVIHDPAERTRALEVRVTDAATGAGLGAVVAFIEPGEGKGKKTTPLGNFYVQNMAAGNLN